MNKKYANRTAAALLRELKRVDMELEHALARSEEIGDRVVPEHMRGIKAEIIDRYNDDIYALSQLRYELEQAIEEMGAGTWS